MDRTFKFYTDTATLAVFDPHCLRHRVEDDDDWWCYEIEELEEVQAGAATLISLGGDGVYQTRITDGDLTRAEHDYAGEVLRNLGVEVVGDKLFVGPGECLPGGGIQFEQEDAERGQCLEIANGEYSLDIFSIHWHDSPHWWTPDDLPPDDAPADIVIRIRQREVPFPGVASPPRLVGSANQFLFESSTRQIGPQPGMILTTRVRKNAQGELTLKECGPCYYSAALTDYSQVKWKEDIRFKVISVDHESQCMTGEFVEKVSGD